MNSSKRVPVTVLTGFLGSGKTTLLNRILSENHGKRIAVIENEFGEVGVDNELVIGAEEEIFEMNNGCICCTVRGDLIRILGNLMKRRDKFDYIMVETTGMADPGPVAQTFFMDEEVQRQLELDAIVTLVDAKHIEGHLDKMDEAGKQIAFADVILLNKTDLVSEADLERIERRISAMNAAAKVFHTRDAALPLDKVLNVGAFDLNRALAVDDKFLEPEYPFEWGGVYRLERGRHRMTLATGPDPSILLALVPASSADAAGLSAQVEAAVRVFADDEKEIAPGGRPVVPGNTCYRLALDQGPFQFDVDIAESGAYALFTEHHRDEFDLRIQSAELFAAREFKPDHEHDEEIKSVGITDPGALDSTRLNAWISQLLRDQGNDIFRMKGVLNVAGEDRRVVFQGVHMLFDAAPERKWGTRPRYNRLIFIGRNLDRAALESGFRACLA